MPLIFVLGATVYWEVTQQIQAQRRKQEDTKSWAQVYLLLCLIVLTLYFILIVKRLKCKYVLVLWKCN